MRAVALGEDGIITTLKPAAAYIDMSTIEPDASRAVAQEFAAKELAHARRADLGEPGHGQGRQASIMVGGDEAAFEEVTPVLLAIGPKVTRIGGNGLACQMKIAVNLLLMVEVIAFGGGGGARRVRAASRARSRSTPSSRAFRGLAGVGHRGPFVIEGRMPAKPLADVTLQQKDMVLALDLGAEARQPGAARRRRQRDDECLPRARHRLPRFRHRP